MELQILLLMSLVIQGESVHNLTFMFMTSFGQSGFNASGVVPAADIALEDINSHPDVLNGYQLVYDTVRDSQCHRGRSLDAFFDGIFSDTPKKLALIGCGCSVATEPVAEISHQWNISHISYASSSAALSDRSKFRSFFRNTFNMKIIAPALRSAVAYFNWTRIALLTQDEGLFTGTDADIMNEFESGNKSVIAVESRRFGTDDDPVDSIEDLFVGDDEYRVFFINSFSDKAREIICFAQKHGYTYPWYAWIVYDWYRDGWWRSDEPGDCSNDDLERFLDKVLTIQLPEFGNGTTDIGTTLTGFRSAYEERARNGSYIIINQAYKLYDVLWVLALALNDTVAMIERNDTSGTGCEAEEGELVPLEQFDYTNKKLACLIQWNIQNTSFSGLTGPVAFDEHGTRIHTNVFFLQYTLQDGGLTKSARFAVTDSTENFTFTLLLPDIDIADIYPNGPPRDGTPDKIIHTFESWLVGLYYILACFGITFAIVCLIFNLVFRKRKTVRLSSPTLNYFIVAGAILMYMSIFFYFLPTQSDTIVRIRCIIRFWLFTIGYSLAFGAVFVKMWRVYQIFHNPQPNRKVLTDWKLIAIALGIAGLTTLFLTIGEAVPQTRGRVQLVEDAEHGVGRNEFGIREFYCVWVCQAASSPSFYWQIFIFTYLIMLQVIGLVLAIQTRKVKLRGLRDSKYVAAVIYISSISIVVMALVTFALDMYINIGTAILATGIFLIATIFLVLIFVPKMVLLYKDPHGKKLSVGHMSSGCGGGRSPQGEDLGRKIAMLEKTMLERERVISELKGQIGVLKKDTNSVQTDSENDKPVDEYDEDSKDPKDSTNILQNGNGIIKLECDVDIEKKDLTVIQNGNHAVKLDSEGDNDDPSDSTDTI